MLINVYLLPNYHTNTSDIDFNICLGELSGFIDSQSFDQLLIGSDFNTDLHSDSFKCNLLMISCWSLILLVILLLPMQRDDGLVTSWSDHFLASSSLA